MAEPDGYYEFLTKEVLRTRDSVSGRLRSLADEIDALPVRTSLEDLKPDHSSLARDVTSKLLWAVANLPLDLLARRAHDADLILRSANRDEDGLLVEPGWDPLA